LFAVLIIWFAAIQKEIETETEMVRKMEIGRKNSERGKR
jgi:hypothetical protein